MSRSTICIGLMSGTSLDGVDAVAADFGGGKIRFIARSSVPFDPQLRAALSVLTADGPHEIERMGPAAIGLMHAYAEAVRKLLEDAGLEPGGILALGAHGQTIRHRPEAGWTLQLANPALLAELTGIDVIADFRSRDCAAGGEGAPLVPAFHAIAFGGVAERAIVNIGGISNISVIRGGTAAAGFDCGPGNVLMDGWAERHLGLPFDRDGQWAAGGRVCQPLLGRLLSDSYFARPAPKSTGREHFCLPWLEQQLDGESAQDVQATILELTARGISDAVMKEAPHADAAVICGGGARNRRLMERLSALLPCPVMTTGDFGIDSQDVEALAFAWLAWAHVNRIPGNVPHATGSAGPRILGACWPH